jgi:hypothetical protein
VRAAGGAHPSRTFDASVVRRTAGGFDVLSSCGLDDVGGLDIDAAVIAYLGAVYSPTTTAIRRRRDVAVHRSTYSHHHDPHRSVPADHHDHRRAAGQRATVGRLLPPALGIRTAFKSLKTHQRGPRQVLRSHNADGITQELYAYLITYQAVRALMQQAAITADIDPTGCHSPPPCVWCVASSPARPPPPKRS